MEFIWTQETSIVLWNAQSNKG